MKEITFIFGFIFVLMLSFPVDAKSTTEDYVTEELTNYADSKSTGLLLDKDEKKCKANCTCDKCTAKKEAKADKTAANEDKEKAKCDKKEATKDCSSACKAKAECKSKTKKDCCSHSEEKATDAAKKDKVE